MNVFIDHLNFANFDTQVFTFNNLFNIIHLSGGVDQVTSMVLLLLTNERLEVREKAAQVLGGLVHCDFLHQRKCDTLLAQFRKNASGKLPRSLRGANVSDFDSALIMRHAGILGLCAFVNAYPYDVPEFLPDILVSLGDHLNDPQPIPVSIFLFFFSYWHCAIQLTQLSFIHIILSSYI